jgi:predicted permease
MLTSLFQDLRYALRTMLANPLFTGMAMLSLALGIGANTAIYSFMDAILMRALPVQDPQSLVVFQWHAKDRAPVAHSINGTMWGDPKTGQTSPNLPFPFFEKYAANPAVFSTVFGYTYGSRYTALIQGQGMLATGQFVSGGFFSGLGAPPAAGRLIGLDDDRLGAPAVLVASYGFAQRRFGDPAKALGETVTLNDVPFTIIGVAPPGFQGISPGSYQDLYLPLRTSVQLERIYRGDPMAKYTDQNFYWLEMMGRLRPGVTLAQARTALSPVFHEFVLRTATTDEERAKLPELLLEEGATGLDNLRRQYSKPLYVLFTMVALILAIACANLANLLLARAASRRREMAVRLSLGAGRLRVIRQLLTESVLLSSFGGVLGLAFAAWGIRGLSVLIANGRSNFVLNAGLNWRVLAVTMAIAMVTGVLFGMAPALQSARVDLTSALKETRAGERRWRVRSWLRVSLSQTLVVAQIAVSLLLLIGAGLFVRTLRNLNSVELGFNREHVLLFNVNARQAGYKDDALVRFYDNLQARLAQIPGVRSASASNFALVSQSVNSTRVSVPGYTGSKDGISLLAVAPGFLATMQIPVVLGREFNERDIGSTAKIAVVNEVFVKTYMAGQNPLGRRFTTGRGPNASEVEIVGVAKDARYSSLKGEVPAVAYLPYSQNQANLQGLNFELRAAGDPLALANAARDVVRQADARIPVADVRTQEAVIDQTIGQERTFAMLCTGFAVLAVLIACVGLYGTMAYSVARRTNEIGLRMALGAERRRLVWMVLREVLAMSVAGLAIGLPLAFWLSAFVKAFLFGMKPADPWALTGAAVLLLAAAIAAGYGPAWRASRIDPWSALRHE